jgi:predicted dehydrogenase
MQAAKDYGFEGKVFAHPEEAVQGINDFNTKEERFVAYIQKTPNRDGYTVEVHQRDASTVQKAREQSYNNALTKEIIDLAHERKVFLAEAIWTRYQPVVGIVRDLIRSGRIGQPRLVTANLGYSMGDKPRIMRPDLCGGALLDLGVYVLNFVRMFFPDNIISINGSCVKSSTGVDLTNTITLVLSNGMLCNLQSSAQCVGHNIGVITGTVGNLVIDNVNNPQSITLYGHDHTYVETIRVPQQITGYEYQFLACRQALAEGLLESREMPHEETLYVMQLMDDLSRKWGVRYPMDKE